MKTKRIKEIKPGEILGDSVYRSQDIAKIANRSPVIAQGTVLTERMIAKLTQMFGEDYEILIKSQAGTKVQQSAKKVEKKPALQKLNYFAITEKQVSELYKNVFSDKEIYNKTKAKLLNAFNKLNGVLNDFQTTGDLDEQVIVDVGIKLAGIVEKDKREFDPAFVYIIELEAWDSITFNHSFDVAAIALAFATHLTSDAEQLASYFVAGLMHDIGKFLYSKFEMTDMDYIIKKNGRLTDEEYEQVKKHVDVEPFLKERFNEFKESHRDNIIFAAIDHHEKYNGYGYINSKRGSEISFAGRLVAICDVYDAMLRERSYKTAMKPFDAMRVIKDMTEQGHFDPILFKKFYKALGKYPVGSVVNTNLGIGVVVEQSKNHERPVIFFTEQGEIDTSRNNNVDIYTMDF